MGKAAHGLPIIARAGLGSTWGGRLPTPDFAGARSASAPLFRLDLTESCLYKARTSRQAVSNASVGTEHLNRFFAGTGTNLDECRSNAVDHS